MLEQFSEYILVILLLIIFLLGMHTNKFYLQFKLKYFIYFLCAILLSILIQIKDINFSYMLDLFSSEKLYFVIDNKNINTAFFVLIISFIFTYFYHKKHKEIIFINIFIIIIITLNQFAIMHFLNILFYAIIYLSYSLKNFEKKDLVQCYITIIIEMIYLLVFLSVCSKHNLTIFTNNNEPFLYDKIIILCTIITIIKCYLLITVNNHNFYFFKLISVITSSIILFKYTQNNFLQTLIYFKFYYLLFIIFLCLLLLFNKYFYNLNKYLLYKLKHIFNLANNFIIQIVVPFYSSFLFFILPQVTFDILQLFLKLFHTGSLRRSLIMVLLVSITYFYIVVI